MHDDSRFMNGENQGDTQGQQAAFRAYPFARILGVMSCDECSDPDCGDGDVVDITSEVKAMENELARYTGRTQVIE